MKAILGGTFDPVHLGHLHVARIGRQVLDAPTVTLLLAARPGHRAAPMANIEHRWRMLCLAADGDPGLEPSNLEILRPGPSYTIDTLIELADAGPLIWLVGSDALEAIGAWHRVDELSSLCHLLVFARPDSGQEKHPLPPGFERFQDAAELTTRPGGGIHFPCSAMLDISATEVRRQIAEEGDACPLLPERVWAYINEHGLYGAHRRSGQANDGRGLPRKGGDAIETVLKDLVMTAVEDRKAVDPVALDVSTLTDVTDYMVIVSGTSSRHVKAIVDNVLETAKASGADVLSCEGRDGNDWVLVDLADVVVHVMRTETREFYDLERLWETLDAPTLGSASVKISG